MNIIETNRDIPVAQFALSIAVWELRQAIQSCLIRKDVGRYCNVVVTENGPQLVLSGTVDSERTHAEILAMIPDEERCVVDNLQVVGSPMLQRVAG